MVRIEDAPKIYLRNQYGDKVPINLEDFSGYGVTFVFGSNFQGRHGMGAAKFAYKKLDADYGVGDGCTGHCYAIPTRAYFDGKLETLFLPQIRHYVYKFIRYTKNVGFQSQLFYLTKIGCGLAGYDESYIAPMFRDIPYTVIIPEDWLKFFPDDREILFYKDNWL